MKKVWLGSSWKMNKTGKEIEHYCREVKPALLTSDLPIQTFLIPPFPYVEQVTRFMSETPCLTGVQNIGWAECGAYTGEVSAAMAKDIGATLVEIGHSERRQWFGETDDTVNQKVRLALKSGLKPLVCVGDTLEEKQWGVSKESIIRQVKIALYQVSGAQASNLLIAYEPVWAIGDTGIPATTQQAEEGIAAIRSALVELYGSELASQMVLLYGGSVNQENARSLINQPNIDGLFVGRAAWTPEGYLALVTIVSEQVKGEEYAL
ncbi:triose-phosphate isomerase [Vibrio sp. E150_011]|uniref:triose-phosphate isomerase n=1 Tax=Vibrio sp. 10N.261.51.F12 TaxID=3229679 RepID=UPI0035521731